VEAAEFGSLFLRTVLIYFVVFIVMRLMGKREIGKMSVLDLVISFMIAEIAVIVIEDTKRSMWHGVFPMALLMLLQIAISYVTMKNRKLRLVFDGKPSIIVQNGELDRHVMHRGRYNLDDLMLQLRENGISSVSEVEFAILETSGKLSVIKKEHHPATAVKEAKNPIFPQRYRFEMLPVPLIMDGKVQDDNLEKMEKTRFWLKNELQQHGVTDFKDVFFCTIDHRGRWYVDKKRSR
jgi:Predicted membrane protein